MQRHYFNYVAYIVKHFVGMSHNKKQQINKSISNLIIKY